MATLGLRHCAPLLVTGVLVAVTGCWSGSSPVKVINLARIEERPVPPGTSDDVAMAKSVTADRIYTIYSQNLIEGARPDQRFFKKLVVISGVFNGMNTGLPGKNLMELRTHDPDAFVYAEAAPDAYGSFVALKPGDNVRMVCRGASSVGGSPILRACRPA